MAISAWSQAPRKVHFFWLPIPAYAFLPFALTLFHLRLWTICLTLVVVAVLSYLSWKGRTVQWLARRAQLRLRAGGLQARPIWYRRRRQMLQSLDVVKLPNLGHLVDGAARPPARTRAPAQTRAAQPSPVRPPKTTARSR